ncbi:MAG: hypothetical protein K2J10_02235 [Muribaculaceae bacterium]|nr:hypothetical protein [Muribaculaceae bacterium]
MQKFFIITFIAGVLLSSCSKPAQETEIIVESFPIEESLPGTRIDLADGEYISNLAYFAGDYLVFNAIRDKFSLQIYDRQFNLVDKILYRGEGPNELPDAFWLGQWNGNPSDPTVLVYSDGKRRIESLNIHPFDSLTTVCNLPASEVISPSSIYMTSDTTLVGITLDMFNGSDLFSYNLETKTVRKAERPFKFVDGYESFYTSQQFMDYDREKLNICCAYNSFPTMVIYDKDFNIVRIVNVGQKVNTAILRSQDNYPSFGKVAYYKNFILAMLMNEEHDSAKLLVFDQNGDPRASYDIGNAIGFIIDELGERLLTVKYDYSEIDAAYLESHPLPELLK